MTTSRRLAALPLMLIGLAALCAALVLIPWIVHAQSQEVTPTSGATGSNPPAKPTTLCAIAFSLGVQKISYRSFKSTHGVLYPVPDGGYELLIKTPKTNDTYMQVLPTVAHEIGHLLIRKDDAGELDIWVSQARLQVRPRSVTAHPRLAHVCEYHP